MKNKLCLLATSSLSLAMLVACGKANGDEAGFASETTNGIAMRGETSPGAIITAYYAAATSSDSIRANTKANESGQWEMKVPPGGYLFVIAKEDSAYSGNVVVRADDSLDGIEIQASLQKRTNLQGRISSAALSRSMVGVSTSKEVLLCGLGERATVASDGSFEFKNIPEGNYLVRLEVGGVASAEAMAQTGSENILNPSDTSLVLEDFDDQNNNTNLSTIFGSSFWLNWLAKDSVTIVPSITDDWDITPLLTDSSAFKNTSLHVIIDINENAPQEPSLLLVLGSRGVKGEDENYHSLCKSDSLAFQAKGSGKTIVDLWVREKDSGNNGHLYTEITLDSNWTRHTIAWKTMLYNDSNEPIGDKWCNLEVLKITWKFQGDVDFWLDQIEIPDMKISDLLAP